MKSNLLIVTSNFPPSKSIGTQRILKICKYLSKNWQIYVLTQKSKYLSDEYFDEKQIQSYRNGDLLVFRTSKLDLYSFAIHLKKIIFDKKYRISDNSLDIKKNRTKNRRFSFKQKLKSSFGVMTDILEFPDKDIQWVPFAVVKGYFIIKKYKLDIIFSSAPRHSNLIVALLLKLITRKKLVVDFRDPWARSPWLEELRIESSLERLKHKIVQFLERKIVEHADTVIFINRSLKDEFANNYKNLPGNKFRVFYNGYDPDRLADIQNKRRQIFANKATPIIFSHIGSLYKKRNPERLLRAISNVVQDKPEIRGTIKFLFLGRISSYLRYVEDLVKKLEIDDIVQFLPPVDYLESFTYMEKSDILIILQPCTKLMLPAKFYDYICYDKPIFALGEKGSEVKQIIDKKFGIFVDYSKIEDIQNGINFLYSNPFKYNTSIFENRNVFNISNNICLLEKILLENYRSSS